MSTTVILQGSSTPPLILVGRGGLPGTPGPKGDPGFSGLQTIQRLASTPLGGHRAVKIEGGSALYASNDEMSAPLVVGLTLGAVLAGDFAQILFHGEVDEPTWSWNPGPIFLGLEGQLTQTPPLSGHLIQVGTALSATTLIIDPTFIATL